jgi:signal transduction histidine kinase
MSSLSRKISLTFSLLAALTLSLTGLAFLDLWLLEQRVEQGMLVVQLETTVQDMRRAEKNFLLYQDSREQTQALMLAHSTAQLIQQIQQTASLKLPEHQAAQLFNLLQTYVKQLKQYQAQTAEAQVLEVELRNSGHHLTQTMSALFGTERQALTQAISHARWAQVMGLLLFIVCLIGLGYWLRNAVLKPLKRFIAEFNPIIDGRFTRLSTQSPNSEILTLRNAVNRLLDELEQRQNHLIQSEKLAALGTLVTGVAHELNNPLANISSSCQLLLEELDSAERDQLKHWAQSIDQETGRATQIVAALLNFGRRRELQQQNLNVADLIQQTLPLLQGYLRQHQAQVELNIAPELTLRGDAQRLQQVFINLLRNAVNAKANLIRIQACYLSDAELCQSPQWLVLGDCKLLKTPALHIRIQDNGQGIAPDVLPHIFEPFFSTQDPGNGMGLGLYIVHSIMQEHAGCIAISSQPKQGTSLSLQFPLSRDRV